MRSQLRRDAIPYLERSAPAVQQHKMTTSFADCLPPDVVHPLPFSFTGQKAKYANSITAMLAMPNAAGSRPLGDLLPLQRRAPARLSPALPAAGPPAAASRHRGRCSQSRLPASAGGGQ